MGWVNGTPVHLLTTADGTGVDAVTRRVGQEKKRVTAPIAVKRYNRGMQGVDRFDQLMSLFSLAKRHQFKKYYHKLTLGLMDFALTNAELHYFLANPQEKKQDNHR